MLSCADLIQIFNKVGGKLTCSYDSKICEFLPQNIECNIRPTDSREIAKLLSYLSPVYEDFITDIPKKTNDNTIEVLHQYQDPSLRGFIVEFSVNKHGTIIKTKK